MTDRADMREKCTLSTRVARPASEVGELTKIAALLAVLLLPIQNAGLPFGGPGAAASVVPIFFFGILYLADNSRNIAAITIPNWAMLLALYVTTVTTIGLVQFDWNYKSTNLLVKAAYSSAQFTMLISGFFVGIVIPRNWWPKALTAVFLINLFGILLNPSGGGAAIGFSSEPSHLGVETAITGLTLAYFQRSVPLRFCQLALTVAVIIYSTSKGAISAFAIALLVVFLLRTRSNKRQLLLLMPPITAAVGILSLFALQQIKFDLDNFTSTVTRLAGAMTAILVGLEHPFGVGLGGFFPAFAETLPRSWNYLRATLGPDIDMEEVLKFAYSSDRDLSTKTFITDLLVYFGFPGVILVLYATGNIARMTLVDRRPDMFWLAMSLTFAIIASCTYYAVIPFFVVPIVFGLAYTELRST